MDISQLSQLLEFTEAYAWADQYAATPEDYREEFGLVVENLGSAVVLAMPANEDTFFNRVIGLHILNYFSSYFIVWGLRYVSVRQSHSAGPKRKRASHHALSGICGK